jgi:hypothetical protein
MQIQAIRVDRVPTLESMMKTMISELQKLIPFKMRDIKFESSIKPINNTKSPSPINTEVEEERDITKRMSRAEAATSIILRENITNQGISHRQIKLNQ